MLVRRIGLVYPAAVWSLARNLRRWDVVGAVVPGIIGNLFITAARATGTPVFLLVRGEKQRTVAWMFGESRSKPLFIWALRQMERPVRRWAKKGVPTFVAGEELALRYRVPGANVHNLYPGLSSDFPFASAPRTSGSAAHDGPLRLITVSRLSLEKGIDDLLRAVDLLRAQSVGASVTVIGEGPDRDRLESVAAGLGLDGLVDFRGFVPHGPELVRALDEADVFVLPSKSEGLPHSLVEAMARALPVITTTIGGMPALLADGGGLLVAPGDPQALAAAIARLGGNPQERAALSARSLEKAQAFTSDRILEEFCTRLGVTYPQLGWPASPRSS
jgi:glycosyltransferase involved in cell wall biosynthesis